MDYAEQLRTADLRVTRPRVAVLEAVNAHPHADTETIFGAVLRCPTYPGKPCTTCCMPTAAGFARSNLGLRRALRAQGRRQPPSHRLPVLRVIADVDCAVGYKHSSDGSDHNGFLLTRRRSSTGVYVLIVRYPIIFAITSAITSSITPTPGRNAVPGATPTHCRNPPLEPLATAVLSGHMKYPAEGGGNQDWWPNLGSNLKVLHQTRPSLTRWVRR